MKKLSTIFALMIMLLLLPVSVHAAELPNDLEDFPMVSDTRVDRANTLLRSTDKVVQTYINNRWYYSRKNSKTKDWFAVRNKRKQPSDCAVFASHAMQDAGFLKPGQCFYIKGGRIKYRGTGTQDTLRQNFEIIRVNKKANKVKFQNGDIVLYKNHVNIYRRTSKRGNRLWYDAGTKATAKHRFNSRFTRKLYYKKNIKSRVYYILRVK